MVSWHLKHFQAHKTLIIQIKFIEKKTKQVEYLFNRTKIVPFLI